VPKKPDLTKMSDDELEKELSRRRQERLQKRRDERQEANNLIVQHVDALLRMVTKHGKTSCSDASPRNDYINGCDRCTLLNIRASGCMDHDYKLMLSFAKDAIEDAK